MTTLAWDLDGMKIQSSSNNGQLMMEPNASYLIWTNLVAMIASCPCPSMIEYSKSVTLIEHDSKWSWRSMCDAKAIRKFEESIVIGSWQWRDANEWHAPSRKSSSQLLDLRSGKPHRQFSATNNWWGNWRDWWMSEEVAGAIGRNLFFRMRSQNHMHGELVALFRITAQPWTPWHQQLGWETWC